MLPTIPSHSDTLHNLANQCNQNLNDGTNCPIERFVICYLLSTDSFAEQTYIVPRNKLEKMLCKVWSDVLGFKNISIKSNFFEIGGDSILSIQVSETLKKAGLNVAVKDIFDYRTVESLAEHSNELMT